jgi:hypothetical protein
VKNILVFTCAVYKGCFSPPSPLPSPTLAHTPMTLQQCTQFCRQHSLVTTTPYVLLTGDVCSCLADHASLEPLADTDGCTEAQCSGNSMQGCGSSGQAVVYAIGESELGLMINLSVLFCMYLFMYFFIYFIFYFFLFRYIFYFFSYSHLNYSAIYIFFSFDNFSFLFNFYNFIRLALSKFSFLFNK